MKRVIVYSLLVFPFCLIHRDSYSAMEPKQKSLVLVQAMKRPKPEYLRAEEAPLKKQKIESQSFKDNKPACIEKKLYPCTLCSASFAGPKNLEIHTRTHTGERPYSCTICANSFVRKYHLTVHMRTHTQEKPYSCSICSKSFGYKSSLNDHMRTHTQEKPYTCNVCTKSFSHLWGFKIHCDTHNDENRFPCHLCSERFSTGSSLSRHMKRKHS
jgi:uncharacterized Zn-finger protein